MTTAAPAMPAPGVVGVGASAGGFEAFTAFLRALPVDTGLAFVFVQHLDPTHASHLAHLLGKATAMPVGEIEDRTRVRANHVYVIPPNMNVTMGGGVLRLAVRSGRGPQVPVDTFLRSLAADRGAAAVGVVLSGTGSDGVLGLQAIKAAGGVTFAQDDASATHTGMPRSAVAAGCVDVVLPPAGIAGEIARVGRHPYVAPSPRARAPKAEGSDDEEFGRILALLRARTGRDLRYYKQTTVRRRIARRMLLRASGSLRDYARYLDEHPDEAGALFQDVLINVTGFFRDPAVFEVVRRTVLPGLLKARAPKEPLRVWVPACSTGEEAYSLAICILEFLRESKASVPLHVFATDVSAPAIAAARAGIYPETISADVSPERLRGFFVKLDGHYRVNKALRDVVVFAEQDVTSDPPFSKLDLISCRNMLIYFSSELQQRIVPVFHYALKPNGFLLLGTAESLRASDGLFGVVDRKHKVYARRAAPARLPLATLSGLLAANARASVPEPATSDGDGSSFDKVADRLVLGKYAPAGVIVNAAMEILHFRGRTGAYLESAPGAASNNLLKMVREGLLADLRAVLQKARKTGAPARVEGVRVRQNGGFLTVNVEVMPLPPTNGEAENRAYLVLFEEAGARQTPTGSTPARPSRGADTAAASGKGMAALRRENAALRAELAASNEHLHAIIDDREAANEELRSATEEIQSSNEELQSTNEELETAKEELQSANEELTTVNDELQIRNSELGQINSDLSNVQVSVSVPLVMVGRDLRIRRFSGAITPLLKLIPADVGRPVGDIQFWRGAVDVEQVLEGVIETLAPQEIEVQDDAGRWHLMRARPYRTEDDRIDGAVLSFVNIDTLKQVQAEMARARDYAEAILETVRQPLLVLDHELRVLTVNRAFGTTFGVSREDALGRFVNDLGEGEWDIPALRTLLEGVLPDDGAFQDFEVAHTFREVGHKLMLLSGRRLETDRGSLILLAFEDRTQLQQRERELVLANEAKDTFLAVLSHELRTPLSAMLGWARLLRSGRLQGERAAHALDVIERNTRLQTKLIEDLLDVSRIVAGKLHLDLEAIEVAPVVSAAVEAQRPSADGKGVRLTLHAESGAVRVLGDADRLQQVVGNLLTNAVKFTPAGGAIDVWLVAHASHAEIRVRDTGAGVGAELLPRLFDRFRQSTDTSTRAQGGLGLGLAISRHLVELHQGTIAAESDGPDQGATFRITLPLTAEIPAAALTPLPPMTEAAAFSRSALEGIRVLVVEDEPDTRGVLVAILEQCGAAPTAAASAREALDVVTRARPDVLISDIAMAHEDGYALIGRVRALPADRGGRTPALALTAYARAEDRARALAAGFDAHVVKPVEPADLVHAVARLVARAEAPPEEGSASA